MAEHAFDPESLVHCGACNSQPSPDKALLLSCGCAYCDHCVETMFTTAINDERGYAGPTPRCCTGPISLKKARSHITPKIARRYKAKLQEYATKDRTYCQNLSCGNFIASHSIHNHQAFCQECRTVTCSVCKEASHYGPCRLQPLQDLMKLAKHQGWMKCPDCCRIVERIDGCRHMQ